MGRGSRIDGSIAADGSMRTTDDPHHLDTNRHFYRSNYHNSNRSNPSSGKIAIATRYRL
jgi:hypothetical protein